MPVCVRVTPVAINLPVRPGHRMLPAAMYDLHLDVENAPLAPSVPDGITQLNVTGTITVDVPLSFGFGHLPPMQITMKLNAKYVPRF